MFTDTHCHLDVIDDQSADDVIARARAAGVTTMINVGTDLASSAQAVTTAALFDGVHAVVGIHPHNAIEATDAVLGRLSQLARHPCVVGIGETGLDFFRDHSPPIRQEESFREHIRLAKELDLALVIHDRDAHEDVIRVLDDERAPDRTVFHCFSGDVALVERCAASGWFVSFAGNVTFRNAPKLREAAAAVPIELLVTETDSPYLSPHPHRGQINEPARIGLTVATLAELHGRSVEDMAAVTSENARRLFRLPG